MSTPLLVRDNISELFNVEMGNQIDINNELSDEKEEGNQLEHC